MNLPELLKIAEAATAGPWEISRMSATAVQGSKGFVVAACGGYSDNRANPDELSKELHGNAEHIATFNPSVAIELIKRLQEAEKLRDEAVDKYSKTVEKYNSLVDKYIDAKHGASNDLTS